MIFSLSPLPFKTIMTPKGVIEIQPYTEANKLQTQCEVVITTPFDRVNGELIDNLPRSVKLIASIGVGLDHIDLDAARRRDLMVTNTPVAKDDTADFTMLLILASARQLFANANFVSTGKWSIDNMNGIIGSSINRQNLCIIGSDELSATVSKRANAFGMKVYYFDHSPAKRMQMAQAEYCHTLAQALTKADFLSLHCQLDDSTFHLIDECALKQMKPSATIINTSRGNLIDEDALITALKNRSIAGAAIDAHPNEPTVNKELLSLDNVILTPHISAGTDHCRQAMIKVLIQNIAHYFEASFQKMNRVV